MTDRTPEPQTADLVKRLRAHATYLERIRRGAGRLEHEAADAIEELAGVLGTIRNFCDAPHWNAARRLRIRELAHNAISKY